MECRNPFQTRSTTSMRVGLRPHAMNLKCRNPFQTRSTTSIGGLRRPLFGGCRVAIPSKPGQRLQYPMGLSSTQSCKLVAIPSKPGQRLQYGEVCNNPIGHGCRNPFQTRSTTSIFLGHNGKTLGNRRNPFQTRSTTSMPSLGGRHSGGKQCRNPFQTRSTTSMQFPRAGLFATRVASQSLPNQVNDFNARNPVNLWGIRTGLSQSLPNQVNDFNIIDIDTQNSRKPCRNPFQTRSTTSIL